LKHALILLGLVGDTGFSTLFGSIYIEAIPQFRQSAAPNGFSTLFGSIYIEATFWMDEANVVSGFQYPLRVDLH